MATQKEELRRINAKIARVLGGKSWAGALNFVPLDAQAVRAFNSMLDYIEMLQDQVKGLEETLRKVR